MDKLTIKKIWQDDYCIKIEIKAQTDLISAKQEIYIDESTFSEFKSKLRLYAEKFDEEMLFVFGDNLEYTSLKFMKKDDYGHIKIAVSMNNDAHNCNFSVDTVISDIDNILCNVQ